ncbi:MAG: hypothetical protein KDC27_08185 [Acidobacteria bacterium]|nr:hypothetical protein [Acidobacteriota bacterium]
MILAALAACSDLGRAPDTIVLWAWERPEDLRFLEPGNAAVAVLAATIELNGDRADARPRSAPLQVRPGIPVTAVVRIEMGDAPALDARQQARAAGWIREIARRPQYAGLQIDFDAPLSARPFYRALLEELRPDFDRLAITALASWCLEERSWLGALPIDEATPMLFRMGPDGERLLARLEREGSFPEPRCRSSVGISIDEPLRWRPGALRLYVFSPRAWTEPDYRAIVEQLR